MHTVFGVHSVNELAPRFVFGGVRRRAIGMNTCSTQNKLRKLAQGRFGVTTTIHASLKVKLMSNSRAYDLNHVVKFPG